MAPRSDALRDMAIYGVDSGVKVWELLVVLCLVRICRNCGSDVMRASVVEGGNGMRLAGAQEDYETLFKS